MLFGDYYSSDFTINPQKEKPDFFTSVLKGLNDVKIDDNTGDGRVQSGLFTSEEEASSTLSCNLDTEKEKPSEKSASALNFSEEREKPAEKEMFCWNFGEEKELGLNFRLNADRSSPLIVESFERRLTLEELAAEHLQNYPSAKIAEYDDEALLTTLSKREDDIETKAPATEPAKKAVQGNRESLSVKCPSSFALVLCRKLPARKAGAFRDVHGSLLCPPEIKPFNFLAPSPDDIVKENQKAQKCGVRN